MRRDLLEVGFTVILLWVVFLALTLSSDQPGLRYESQIPGLVFWGILIVGFVILGLGIFLKDKHSQSSGITPIHSGPLSCPTLR